MDILIVQKEAVTDDFLPGLTCANIYEIKDKKKSKRSEPENALNNALESISVLKSKITQFQVEEINPVIRALGRRKLVTPIFELLDCMRAASKHIIAFVCFIAYATLNFICLFLYRCTVFCDFTDFFCYGCVVHFFLTNCLYLFPPI